MFSDFAPAWVTLFIFLARSTDVTIGTVRHLCVIRGRRKTAGMLGFVEASIWVMATGSVFSHLSNWMNVVAFAGGFACGNMLGMWIEEQLAIGVRTVRLISREDSRAIVERLRKASFKVTTIEGRGAFGPVEIALVIVYRKSVEAVVNMARQIDPQVVVTVDETHSEAASVGVCPRERAVWRNLLGREPTPEPAVECPPRRDLTRAA
jgi:uncharacterized protein YebE (UPF0316 family)